VSRGRGGCPDGLHPVQQVPHGVGAHTAVAQGRIQRLAQTFLPYLVLKGQDAEELLDSLAVGVARFQEGQGLEECLRPRG
jgi:hypothetical protein